MYVFDVDVPYQDQDVRRGEICVVQLLLHMLSSIQSRRFRVWHSHVRQIEGDIEPC